MGGEVGVELLETFIGAEATVVMLAQETDKTFQMSFSINASAPTARSVMDPDGADGPSEAKARPSAPVQPGGAEQPGYVDQFSQADQCHSEAPCPHNLVSMQQAMAVRMSFCDSGGGLVQEDEFEEHLTHFQAGDQKGSIDVAPSGLHQQLWEGERCA
eukprot:501116-Prymnesium_polylepis.1